MRSVRATKIAVWATGGRAGWHSVSGSCRAGPAAARARRSGHRGLRAPDPGAQGQRRGASLCSALAGPFQHRLGVGRFVPRFPPAAVSRASTMVKGSPTSCSGIPWRSNFDSPGGLPVVQAPPACPRDRTGQLCQGTGQTQQFRDGTRRPRLRPQSGYLCLRVGRERAASRRAQPALAWGNNASASRHGRWASSDRL